MNYRAALPRLALVMLALTASYGVYEFQRIFTPMWVALASAAAFELVYVALALFETPDRRRAQAIAFTAVSVSVVYNSLAALFTRRPDMLIMPPTWADVALAALHGAPLAIVAYNLSVLLVHARTPAEQARNDAEHERITMEQFTITAGRITTTVRQLSAVTGIPVSTLYRRLEQPAALTDGNSAPERTETVFQSER